MKKKIDVSLQTINTINKKQIRPIPRWEFVAKNWGLWLGLGLCLGLLTIAIGISWFGIIENIIVPYSWLFVATVFLGLAFLFFEKTRRAYRFEKVWVIVFLVIIGTLIGGTIFKFGIASKIDRGLGQRSSLYRQMVPLKLLVWNNPEDGYLSGEIVRLTKDGLVINSFDGKEWNVLTNNPLVRGRIKIAVGEKIKLIGTKIENNVFEAGEIRPWGGVENNY